MATTPRVPHVGREGARQWAALAAFVACCLGVGALGAIATTPEIEGWYRTLSKPAWTPPDGVFGPVWTTLYVLMGVAAWDVWRRVGLGGGRVAFAWFGLHLLLNGLWSWVFFGFHQPGWALLNILILWIAIAATTIAFWQRSRLAGWLLVPYMAWVAFAGVLNFAIWQLNRA